ncbi:MAG: O-antigen ligase family protein, partial [bacterium]|nr:O-antigen ligase family protein [bacterium]
MLKIEELENQLVKCFAILAGAIFFIPLLIINNILRPYILSKTIPFQIMVLALLIVWMFLLTIDFKKYRPKLNIVFIALTVFTLAVFLSSVFSLDFYRSFWGNAERTEGFVNLLYLYFFGVAFFSVLKNQPKMLKGLVFVTLVASFFVSLFPILQRLSILRILPGEQLSRPGGSLGNPTFLAGYLSVHIFLAIWFFFQNIAGNQKFRKLLSWSTIFIFLVDGAVFIWTQTRGSLIGVFLGVVAALAVALFTLPKKQKKLAAGILIFAVMLAVLFFAFRPVIRDSALAKKVPVISRLASISLNDGTTLSRLESWKWSLNWWLKRPILGAGQDMFYQVFDKNYSADNMAVMSERFDRAHNKYIDVLVMNGAVGLIAYLFLLLAAVITAIRQIKKTQNFPLKIAWLSAVALLVAYFTHNFFVFDTPVNSLIFYFVLGWLMTVSISETSAKEEKSIQPVKESAEKRKFPSERLIASAILAIVVFGPIFYFTDYKPFKAGRFIYEAAVSPQEKIDEVFGHYRQAIKQNTFISSEARRMWGDYWLRVLIYNRFQQPLMDAESLKKYTSEVLSEMDKGYAKEAMVDFYIYSANINTQLSGTSSITPAERQYYTEQEDKWFSILSQNWPKRTDFYTIYVEDQI